jgi:hypothetical protein
MNLERARPTCPLRGGSPGSSSEQPKRSLELPARLLPLYAFRTDSRWRPVRVPIGRLHGSQFRIDCDCATSFCRPTIRHPHTAPMKWQGLSNAFRCCAAPGDALLIAGTASSLGRSSRGDGTSRDRPCARRATARRHQRACEIEPRCCCSEMIRGEGHESVNGKR